MTSVLTLVPTIAASFDDPASQSGSAFGVPTASGTTGPIPAPTNGTVVDPAGNAAAAPARQGGFGLEFMLPVIAVLVGMMLLSIFSQRKEQKKRAALLSAVKRGDRVQTAGGVIGVVAELSDSEMVLNVEQGRIRFARSALVHILRESKDGTEAAKVEGKTRAA